MTQVQRIYLLKMWFSIAALNSQRVIKVQPPSSSYQKGSQTLLLRGNACSGLHARAGTATVDQPQGADGKSEIPL